MTVAQHAWTSGLPIAASGNPKPPASGRTASSMATQQSKVDSLIPAAASKDPWGGKLEGGSGSHAPASASPASTEVSSTGVASAAAAASGVDGDASLSPAAPSGAAASSATCSALGPIMPPHPATATPKVTL